MTQREEFEKYFFYSGLADKDKQLCECFWNKGFLCGVESAKAQAAPETNKDLLQSLHDMVEIVGANFCSNQDVKRKYKIARELLEQNK